MSKEKLDGFVYNNKSNKKDPKELVEGFSAKCNKCNSSNIEIAYEFSYYGGMTGWSVFLNVNCNDCGNAENLDV